MAHSNLNAEKALIWRIVHVDNLAWILENGLHCGNNSTRSPSWVHIGNQEIIERRGNHEVPIEPNGVLNDYVPFYFTPFSIMMYNIYTGRSVTQRKNEQIVILVSSLRKLQELGVKFVFSDRHANVALAQFFDDCQYLDRIDWPLLQRRDFSRDNNDPAKLERYQAEALVFQYCPIDALLGVVCYTDGIKKDIDEQASARGLTLNVLAKPNWYF